MMSGTCRSRPSCRGFAAHPWASRGVVVAVDEAYAEISGESLADVVLGSPNGVLVRTFSKGYGLAGARVGYLSSNREVVQAVESIRLPQNLTAFGIAAASRAVADESGLQERVDAILG